MSALLNAILLNAFAATALAVAVWVAGKIPAIGRRPGLRQGLWIVVLLKLVTPPLFELPILPGWLVADPAPMLHPKSIPIDELSVKSSVAAGEPRPERPHLAEPNTATGIDWLWIAAFVNGFGILTVLTFATCQIWRLRHALRGGATNDERLRGIGVLMGGRMGLRVVPTVCVVAANVSPLLWVRRSGPLIVLPRRLVEQLTDEQMGCVISHEIAHYLRRDHWANLLSLILAAVCWWNPIAWWARRELRMAQEACCDALVISREITSRRKYAETLLQALEFIQAKRSFLPALASGFGGKSSTERRFEMIANRRVSHRLSWRNYALLIAALAVLPCSLAATEAQDVASDNEIGVSGTVLRTPKFNMSEKEAQQLADYFAAGFGDDGSKEKKNRGDNRNQGGKESEALEKPIGVPLSHWGHSNSSGNSIWVHRSHDSLKTKDCRACHAVPEEDRGGSAWLFRFHNSLKV